MVVDEDVVVVVELVEDEVDVLDDEVDELLLDEEVELSLSPTVVVVVLVDELLVDVVVVLGSLAGGPTPTASSGCRPADAREL